MSWNQSLRSKEVFLMILSILLELLLLCSLFIYFYLNFILLEKEDICTHEFVLKNPASMRKQKLHIRSEVIISICWQNLKCIFDYMHACFGLICIWLFICTPTKIGLCSKNIILLNVYGPKKMKTVSSNLAYFTN